MLSWQSHAASWDQPRPAHIGWTFSCHCIICYILDPHAALDPPSSITEEAAAMMHPDTSIMNGSQACSCTIF